METLERLLDRHWRLGPVRMQTLTSGHTNKTCLVHGDAQRSVLRVSWAGKSVEQVQREASVLERLRPFENLPALPRPRPTIDAEPAVKTIDGRWLHLFEPIDGHPGLPDDTAAATVDAMRTLARLHIAMATITADASSPITWLTDRYARVSARAAPSLSGDLLNDYEVVLKKIRALLDAANGWVSEPPRWVHGDYHAGNLLFVDSTVSGIIDFDDVGQGSHWLEAAFALFALSRDVSVEQRLAFDAALWDAGLSAYAEARSDDPMPDWMNGNRDALKHLFCAEQTLIHVEAAQRGLWVPGPGIGFLGCWHQLLMVNASGL